ncbi:uncharacterized protein BP01DRAFT_353981 [Aspergillus saccharolyticus JOP 1030-1]|uniref:RING-type domain-containing protein n=1 Tax=Aspergillus saccharolyticus JOP 1030-1 TaxID=1450539 RepID=A0A318ZN73_9EURO|nr:hypothetical protein BP01DRAFT_353981 [Aspergillus saccharolyticus JOP 1030-1]PYH48135.1 hypothetical protein BP01DRAFT_353981 [Aspergillus saccharolyticus JOP 1030-1]
MLIWNESVITWHRRRRRARRVAAAAADGTTPHHRRDSALDPLTGRPSMQQIPRSTTSTVRLPVPKVNVERWLEEQTRSGTNEPWHFAQESCAICLERLKVEDEKMPTTSTTATATAPNDDMNHPPTAPQPAWIPPRSGGHGSHPDLETGLSDWRRGSLSSASSDLDTAPAPGQANDVLVLKRCNHVFHAACLVLWVEQHRYRCPVCQASLKHSSCS